jgi:hypothetical protein
MIPTVHIREFVASMIGQELQSAQRLSIVTCSQPLRILCGRGFNGVPLSLTPSKTPALTHDRTMNLGPFVGPIYTIILIVDCLFFAFLEWWMPRENIDYVDVRWDTTRFANVDISTLL